MAKNAPYLYIDPNSAYIYESKGNSMPYNIQTAKCRSSSPFLYNQRISRNLQQMSLHNSQNIKQNNYLKTDSNANANANINTNAIPLGNSKFNAETKYNNRMPSPLLRSNPRMTTKLNKDPDVIDINQLLGKDTKLPLTLSILNTSIDHFEQSRCSNSDTLGVITAYSANTHQGIVRTYNEDRVSIIIHLNKPSNWNQGLWPKVSFFGIYDGHGGASCAEYLRDNLHKLISQDEQFPHNIPEAMKNGFAKAEKDFLNNHSLGKVNQVFDKSGSCAIVAFIIDNLCYIANVGDSRAIMSSHNGSKCIMMTTDHKPNTPSEKARITENGGKIYQSQTPLLPRFSNENNQILLGPYRVFPGRLSVSRTIGDIEAKKELYGGLPNVIIATPEIFKYELKETDFIILGCDGIFDQLSNKEVNDCAWMVIKSKAKDTVHTKCSFVIDMILKAAMKRRSLDNVTCLIIAFKRFDEKNLIETHSERASASTTSSSYRQPNTRLSEPLPTKQSNQCLGNAEPEFKPRQSLQDRLMLNSAYKEVNGNNINNSNGNGITSKIKPNIKKPNESNVFNRSDKTKYNMNTARYYNNKDRIEGKTSISLHNASAGGVNQFLTPSHSKINKEVSALKKKKDFLLNDQKYTPLNTETYTTAYPTNMTKTFHMNNNSQRYDTSKYKTKYTNNY